MHDLSILYRGPLSSCNQGCGYCPFALHVSDADEIARDRKALTRFVQWVTNAPGEGLGRLSVFFTPWGEALVRSWYRDAICELSHLPHVARVAIQTNLSCGLDWLRACNLNAVALWTTYHPTEVSLERFVSRCYTLLSMGVRFSVGAVGLAEHVEQIEALRRALPPEVYVWVNAFKRARDLRNDLMLDRWTAIDPLFPVNNVYHPSHGRACRTGESVVSVDGDGNVRRCHFVPDVLGNMYEQPLASLLSVRTCPQNTCGCHIGYVHMNELQLYEVFAGGVLERVPRTVQRPTVRLPVTK